MSDQVEDYIEYIRIERNYSDLTEKNYLIDLEKFEDYLCKNRLNYKSLTYKDISKYIAYLKENLKLKSASINRHLSSLRSFYTFLLNKEVITSNPFKLVNGPKQGKKLPNYMKYSEFEVMINSCDDTPLGIRNQALLELLLATGARIGELINISVYDIDFSNREIKVLGKGN
ncbi:MAG: site-specific integrase, partial [Bacilli bacterium]|nr:site-specific integrase [Bacilli bacterium]